MCVCVCNCAKPGPSSNTGLADPSYDTDLTVLLIASEEEEEEATPVTHPGQGRRPGLGKTWLVKISDVTLGRGDLSWPLAQIVLDNSINLSPCPDGPWPFPGRDRCGGGQGGRLAEAEGGGLASLLQKRGGGRERQS